MGYVRHALSGETHTDDLDAADSYFAFFAALFFSRENKPSASPPCKPSLPTPKNASGRRKPTPPAPSSPWRSASPKTASPCRLTQRRPMPSPSPSCTKPPTQISTAAMPQRSSGFSTTSPNTTSNKAAPTKTAGPSSNTRWNNGYRGKSSPSYACARNKAWTTA